MLSQEVAGRYAGALLLALKERNLVDDAYEQFQAIAAVLQRNPEFVRTLAGPQLPEEQKIALVQKLFGDRVNRLYVEFLNVLIRRNRIQFLPVVVTELIEQIENVKGITRAEVVTAVPLSDEHEKSLLSKLEARTGRRVLLEKRVDPAILGGAIVMMDDDLIDGSVRHDLRLLERQLDRLRVH